MLYPKNNAPQLSEDLFKQPTSEYRGTPFWAWNCKLDKDELLWQIDRLKEMGMGGFHIHSRTGMATTYLSDEFMELVKGCLAKAEREGMLCWLYDEDRWPSGFAGGLVTKDVRYRERFLVFSPTPAGGEILADRGAFEEAVASGESPKGYMLAKYEVELVNGYLTHYRRLDRHEQERTNTKVWWAYLALPSGGAWFNNQTYVNTLDPEAIRKFVEITHEAYYREVGDAFGKAIPAIFTDEPQFHHKETLTTPYEEASIKLPYTDDFHDTYQQAYGEGLLEKLPELIWELPDGAVSVTRYRYHDHVSERFSSAFADTIGSWCEAHGIMLTGHMMDEPSLHSQTKALGEAMRSYRSFQLPGIDMLVNGREFTTAKQAQSAAHQYGRPGVISEMYGVTNWDFDFKGHKLQGDWQAALGVTVRVHHLSWVSMAGEAKRDYPATINYQSPWYKEYPMIENHFSRLHTALSRGKPRVRVGVIHPVESYWLYWGPQEQTAIIREELEHQFHVMTNWLLLGQLDFDFIAESLLPSQCLVASAPLQVGEMKYDVLVVPGCHTLRTSTVERLEGFQRQGGHVIFAGEPAKLVDAIPSERVRSLATGCETIPFTRTRLLDALEPYRDVEFRKADGTRADDLLYQLREDGDNRWLFVCQAYDRQETDIVDEIFNREPDLMRTIQIKLRGTWNPVIYDTMSGEINACPAIALGEQTHIDYALSAHDSLLLLLSPGMPVQQAEKERPPIGAVTSALLTDHVPITLSEPNVLLLDMGQYALDEGEWQAQEELLRIDNKVRVELGYPLKMDAVAQPWVDQEEHTAEHTLHLRFEIKSDIEILGPILALEDAAQIRISVNGQEVPSHVTGWFVDHSIHTVELPAIPAGTNEIILRIPYGSKTNVEWCYLLGDFGVRVEGRYARIVDSVRTLAFGDWTHQGLPFYAGNVTYHCNFHSAGERLAVEIPHYKNPVLSVSMDGIKQGNIAFSPYTLQLGEVEVGQHELAITAFGNRVNAFGAVHNCATAYRWFGPNAWRTTGRSWSYQYQLKPTGILSTPVLYREGSNEWDDNNETSGK